MRIAHELPISLLKYSDKWNGFEYCLPHLLDKHQEYYDHFVKCTQTGKFIIMDNGLFEGVKHTIKDLVSKINFLQPNIFIVPDEWNDSIQTLHNASFWMEDIKQVLPKKTELMIVIQGDTVANMEHTYKTAKAGGYTHFAFNHSSSTYQDLFSHTNTLVNQMMGRIKIITDFVSKNIIESDDYIHLLGCSLPQEFLYYDNYFINSVDTSNPIICGSLKIQYPNAGLLDKPVTKIEDLMKIDLKECESYIEANVKKFKTFCV